jgi:hypothetical protein
MSFNTTSYFAGVATVFAAVTFGLAGGFIMSNPTHKPESPNRIERVAANAPLAYPNGDQAATPVPQSAPAAHDSAAPDATPKDATPRDAAAAAPASAPAPQAVAQQQPAPQPVAPQQPPAQESSVQQVAAAPAPAVAKDDAAELAKIREADLKASERRRAHRRWAERQRHQQEFDPATAQVRQIYRGDGDEVVQRVPVETPRFGLFGNDDRD